MLTGDESNHKTYKMACAVWSGLGRGRGKEGEVVVAGRACLIGAHTESICIATRTVGNTTEVFAYCMTGVVTSTQEIITRARVASVDRCSFISAHFVVSSFSIWFHFLFSFFFDFCFVTVGVYLHEPVVVAFNFLHGVLFMIAKLPCSSGRQEAGRGCVEGHRKQCQSGWESRWWHFRSLSVAFG